MVDANPLISVLMGGAAARVFLSDAIAQFAVAVHTIREVEEFIPQLAERLDEDPEELSLVLSLLPLKKYTDDFYQDTLHEAKAQIGARDPDDIDVLALALKLGCPIWSNDADFEVAQAERFTTAQLMKNLGL